MTFFDWLSQMSGWGAFGLCTFLLLVTGASLDHRYRMALLMKNDSERVKSS